MDEKKFNKVKENNKGTTSEAATKELQSFVTKLSEYGEGIKITETTWDKIEDAGGERLTPSVENNSDATIYYKPEGAEHDNKGKVTGPNPNPGKDPNGAYPIAPGTDLYAPVDGIRTTSTPEGKVFRVPTGSTITVSGSGSPRPFSKWNLFSQEMRLIPRYGNVKPPDPNWNSLSESIPHK